MDLQKYKNIKIVILAGLIVVALFLFWLFGSNGGKETLFRYFVKQSAQDGWEWLSNYREDFNNPITPAVMKIINDKYCNLPVMEMVAQRRWDKFSEDPYYPSYERLFRVWDDYKISDSVKKAMGTPQEGYRKTFAEAMYCDQLPVEDDFENIAFLSLNEETGYDLTRKFWTAILFKKNGCFTRNYNVDEIIQSAAERMAEAQEVSEEVDSLYIERTALLLGYGFRDLVKDEWIKKIIDAQDKSGAWVNKNNFLVKDFEDLQSSMMAIWALSEYAGYCPFGYN